MTHSMHIGDILHYSWGWEQTNCEFYQVVRITPSSVVIQQVNSKSTKSTAIDSMTEYLLPIKDAFMADEPLITKRVSGGWVRMKYGLARLWDGEPKYSSWYG